jgi:hypothetical protein
MTSLYKETEKQFDSPVIENDVHFRERFKDRTLKIKSKDLMSEAQNIRKEERKTLSAAAYHRNRQNVKERLRYTWEYVKLREHRVGVVRNASRVVQLSRAFLKDVPYIAVENDQPLLSMSMARRAEFVSKIKKELKGAIPSLDDKEIIDWIENK